MKKVKRQEINFAQIRNFLESAELRLKKAERIVRLDEQSGFQAAYDATLKVSLAFMLSFGLRPRSTVGHHKAIIEFVEKKLGSEFKSVISSFDIMRRKRNQAIYEPISTISESEADNAIIIAKKYLAIIKKIIRKNDPQQALEY